MERRARRGLRVPRPDRAAHGANQTAGKAGAQPPAPKVSKQSPAADYTPNVRFQLRTELAQGKLAFVGMGGDIEGVVNPTLRVAEGAIVQVGLVNGDGIEHDVDFPTSRPRRIGSTGKARAA